MVHKHIHAHIPGLFQAALCKFLKFLYQVFPWIIPCKVIIFHPDPPQCLYHLIIQIPNIHAAIKFHIRSRSCQLIQKVDPILAGQNILIIQNDIFLAVPKL